MQKEDHLIEYRHFILNFGLNITATLSTISMPQIIFINKFIRKLIQNILFFYSVYAIMGDDAVEKRVEDNSGYYYHNC